MKEQTKKFIKVSRNQLNVMFQDRLDELKESVFIMDAGEKRDSKILFIKEYKVWLNKIAALTDEPNKESKVDYI